MRYWIWIIVILGFLSGSSRAEQPGPAAAPTTISTDYGQLAEGVPVTVPPPSEKALRLYRTGNVWWCVEIAFGLAFVPALLLFSGFSARLRDVARRVGRNWYLTLTCYFLMLALFMYGLSWPLNYFHDFVRPHAYGLSEQSFAKWFGDSLKELALVMMVGAAVLWVPYLLLKKSPRRWWLYTALGMLPFYFFVQLIRPVVIEPLFNQFTPIENKVLEDKDPCSGGTGGHPRQPGL